MDNSQNMCGGRHDFKDFIPIWIKNFLRPYYYKLTKDIPIAPDLDPAYLAYKNKLAVAKKIIDLGCGDKPIQGASAGVDLYIEPKERFLGQGKKISVEDLKNKGIDFVNSRIDAVLPFRNKEFDFAYSRHAFEHLERPDIACSEMIRIAKAGVIITPSVFSELILGKPYHRWLVMNRNNTIFFFKKRPFEDMPFGEQHRWDEQRKRYTVTNKTSPFEILLNAGNWYSGKERMSRLSRILKKHWHAHSALMEVIFLWEDSFDYKVYD